jgi:hypothetical protein
MTDSTWGTDTAISFPIPSPHQVFVDFGDFGFTEFGLVHNLNRVDLEDITPDFIGQRIVDG